MKDLLIPGVQVVKRPLHIFFIVDKSTSMNGIKMNAINQGIPAALHAVERSMKQHPEVEVLVHVLAFGTDLEWVVPKEGVPIHQVVWYDIVAKGKTKTGEAINCLCDALSTENVGIRGYPPVCILMSDGYQSDSKLIYDSAIERLNEIPWGRKAVRLVIGIGSSDDYDEESLSQFGNQPETKIIKVENCRDLVKFIQWASVAASVGSTRSRSCIGQISSNVLLPSLPKGDDVW